MMMTLSPIQQKIKQEEAEDIAAAEVGLKQALDVMQSLPLVMDTNVLCKMFDAKASQRDAIAEIAGRNQPIICDTVFWEFLRNCGLNKYRERIQFLEKHGLTTFGREDSSVRKMYFTLWMTYLSFYKRDPRRMANIPVPDIWIAAFCVQKNYDYILTLDHTGDFPTEVFDDQAFYIGDKITLHLKTFNRQKAVRYWSIMGEADIPVSTTEWRPSS